MENFYDNHDKQYEEYAKDKKQSKVANSWLNLESLDFLKFLVGIFQKLTR